MTVIGIPVENGVCPKVATVPNYGPKSEKMEQMLCSKAAPILKISHVR